MRHGDLEYLFNNLPNCKTLGFAEKESLTKWIEAAYISIFPSVCLENCPMSVLESIALGTPSVGANIGGIPELIQDGYNGVIFEPNNSTVLARVIKDLWNDEKRVEEMSLNCLSTPVLSLQAYASLVLHTYNSLSIDTEKK